VRRCGYGKVREARQRAVPLQFIQREDRRLRKPIINGSAIWVCEAFVAAPAYPIYFSPCSPAEHGTHEEDDVELHVTSYTDAHGSPAMSVLFVP
jgi:hypothetical protein